MQQHVPPVQLHARVVDDVECKQSESGGSPNERVHVPSVDHGHLLGAREHRSLDSDARAHVSGRPNDNDHEQRLGDWR